MRLQVSPLNVDSESTAYDVLVATLGYEDRSSYISRRYPKRFQQVWAFDYTQEPVLSYPDNARHYSQHTIVREPESAHRKVLGAMLEGLRDSLPSDDRTGERVVPRIAVDISSMDRDRLARTVLACTEDQDEPLIVDFFYAFAEFDPDLVGSAGPVLVNRPIDGLEGWPTDPDAAVICVIGLGFEDRLALAAVETIEPRQTVALVPIGEDARYDDVVLKHNDHFLRSGAADAQQSYQVSAMAKSIVDLNASVSFWARESRVVLVPLGPKPFALTAILVGVANPGNVTVWRLSADRGRAVEQRRASGPIAGMRLRVNP